MLILAALAFAGLYFFTDKVDFLKKKKAQTEQVEPAPEAPAEEIPATEAAPVPEEVPAEAAPAE